MEIFTKLIGIFTPVFLFLSLFVHDAPAFEFVPPKDFVSKEALPVKDLNFVRTKQGLTYLISRDGRYVFQGRLIDVWNGRVLANVDELKKFKERVNFKYLGISSQQMFTLSLGTGTDEVFIFSDPNCGVCHKLFGKIKKSSLIKKNFKIHAVITPLLHKTSMAKSKALASMAQKDPEAAMDAFINNSVGNDGASDQPVPGIQYNLLVARALSIQNFPFIVNARGRIHIGMPEDIHLFLFKN
ncbi:disulfide isomerase DsbC N-terminal domain-containing protein [Desulfobacter curvatus]|uniref:disulfide isomerase DsbC N-terminal domain-containing protein n=1 Tax=Desulfobacter curvatus TaxID=2290 RepID=UPI0003619692|nr:thioredoxin fold domain-containing protein [Desulfobacter curvatus]